MTNSMKTLAVSLLAAMTLPQGNLAGAQDTIKSVRIGTQVWMAENLNVDRFRNGDPIPEARTAAEWQRAGKDGTPAWSYFDNNPENGPKYGRLYNWYAVRDTRGLAPAGWHIPTKAGWGIKPFGEFEILEAAAGNSSNALKALGQGTGKGVGTNASGFSAMLAGFRDWGQAFKGLERDAFFWSSTVYDASHANGLSLSADNDTQWDDPQPAALGFSVRCIRDWQQDVRMPATPLVLGQPVVRTMQRGEVHTFQVDLAAGEFLRAAFTPTGIDPYVRIVGPDGQQIEEIGPNGASAPVIATVSAKEPGRYLFGVFSTNQGATGGQYEAKILELSTAAQHKVRLAERAAEAAAMATLASDSTRLWLASHAVRLSTVSRQRFQ